MKLLLKIVLIASSVLYVGATQYIIDGYIEINTDLISKIDGMLKYCTGPPKEQDLYPDLEERYGD